jgi:cystathionine beta-synthase
MSAEKVSVLRALNATIIRTPTEAAYDSPESHIGVAKRLERELPNAHILDQYSNPNNPLAHELGTAEEIWRQTSGRITAIVAGAGTGGTITGLSRGLKKHNPNVKVIAADPHGSILALPASLNTEHVNEPYKVEGIGYDFIPQVLDQQTVDKWYKTGDKESFQYARRLIAEEGLLVGGSSGSAVAAMVQAVKDYGFGKDDTIVVVLPDSIRSYLTKVSRSTLSGELSYGSPVVVVMCNISCLLLQFADDDWLAANDLLPSDIPEVTSTSPASPTGGKKDPLLTAKVSSLRLKPVTTIRSNDSCETAIELMREKGFDQLPVLAGDGKRLAGLITLGNILSWISHGRAVGKSPVSEVMFDFSKLSEVVTDPRDIWTSEKGGLSKTAVPSAKASRNKNRKFIEITLDTPLSVLNRFLEWNSAAVVTERDNEGTMKPIAVATKVDLLTWLLHQKNS